MEKETDTCRCLCNCEAEIPADAKPRICETCQHHAIEGTELRCARSLTKDGTWIER